MNCIATCKCVKLPNSTCTYECDYIRSVMMVGSRCKGLRVDWEIDHAPPEKITLIVIVSCYGCRLPILTLTTHAGSTSLVSSTLVLVHL